MPIIGIADTTFSRLDMANAALAVLKKDLPSAKIVRYTVPGVKDLPVACLKLFDQGAHLVIAFGWIGKENIDKTCGHEASTAIQQVQLMTKKHILEVFIHEDEDKDEKTVKQIALNRAKKHAANALALLAGQTTLTPKAGNGLRQGKEDVGEIK